MKEYVICKSCGFIMEKGKLKDKCPACGVPAKMFTDHQENISPRRRLFLSLDIHPILVHFPQAFAFTVLALFVACLFMDKALSGPLAAAMKGLAAALPAVVAAAFAAGLLDGTVRFRRVTTPILLKKIALGVLFFASSAAGATLLLLAPPGYIVYCAILFTAAEACSAVLGLLGSRITNARFPG